MATENVLQDYELMVVMTPLLSEDDFKSAQKKYTDLIETSGGEIAHLNSWGLRSLAYPINKKTTGLYFVVEFKASSDLNSKMEIQMNRDENIMRHMITRLDKFAVAYNLRKRTKLAKTETVS